MADTDIVTAAEVKKHLNIAATNTTQDDELGAFIEAVTAVIEHIVGPVVPRTVIEIHDGGAEAVVLRRPPVMLVTSVSEEGAALSSGVYATSTDAGVLYRSTSRSSRAKWTGGRGAVTVTYQAGRASTPASVKQAAKELVALNWRPQQGGNHSVFDSAGDATGGQVILGFFVPNRVMQMLAPHAQIDGFA